MTVVTAGGETFSIPIQTRPGHYDL
jgi:hypothetical protein